MTPAERAAYAAGIRTMVDLARRCADALEPRAVHRRTRIDFAMEALRALADEGEALLTSAQPAAFNHTLTAVETSR